MKSLRDYLEESQHAADNPVAGDTFAINIREECLIESVVVESRSDGVVIAADDHMMRLLESYGYTFEENCMECGMPECGCGDPAAYSDDESQDPGEYDQEGSMAKDDLNTIVGAARRLMGLLGDNDNMPEWTQSKIDRAADYVDTAADYIASKKTRGEMDEDVAEGLREPSPVARATLHRIMMRHPGMLAQHGPERVMQAVDDVADLVGDMDDIGSSDISGWVNMVQEILDSWDQGVAEGSDHSLKKVWDRYAKHLEAGRGNHSDVRQIFKSGDILQNIRKYVKDHHGQKAVDDMERYAEKRRWDESVTEGSIDEAEYQGRKVPLGKPMKGDVAKSKVYVKDPKTGNVKKVNFGDPNMKIKKSNPARRKSFRARHNCDNPGPRTSARYWSCRAW
jgi:hypothetical protein